MTRADHVDEFEIDGVGFRLKPLPALVAEKLAPAVTAMLTPAVAALFAGQSSVAELGQALRGLEGAAEQLPKFREAFAAQSLVTIGEAEGQAVWSELKGKVFDDTFRRKHTLYFKWLGRCISTEYGSFLAEIGQGLEEALKGSRWSSLIGSLGGSGDSPVTPESATDTQT
jgi:tail assembly chaperone